MLMKLVFPGGEHQPLLLDRGRYRIGSAGDGEVVIAHEGVEPLHCELTAGPQGVQLRVPGGAHVQVNDRNVDGLIALRPDDMLALGGVRVRLVEAAAGTAGPGPASADDVGATMVRPVVPRFVLRGMSGDQFGRNLPLHAGLSVGRAEDAGLRLAGDGISRLHARLSPGDGEVLVEDLGSANGTWINGKRVLRAQAVHGDEIRFDSQRFQLLVPGQPLPQVAAPAAPAPAGRWRFAALLLAAFAAAAAIALWGIG